MFKELIEKIGKKKVTYTMGYDSDHEAAFDEGWNSCVDSVLKTIESYKPRWVDKPEPNDWYWITDFCNMGIQCVDNPNNCGRWLNVNAWGHVKYFDVIEKDNVFYAKTDEGMTPTNEIGGQWIHVLPETERG